MSKVKHPGLPRTAWLVVDENGRICNDSYYAGAYLTFRSKKAAKLYHSEVSGGPGKYIKITLFPDYMNPFPNKTKRRTKKK